MDFIDLAKRRYSCRKYKDSKVEEEKIMQVLEAARVAPSAKNKQPWHYIVVQEEKNLEKIKSCYKGEWIQSAPLIIVACGDHKVAWRRSDGKGHTDIDLAISIDHLTLAATDAGLATCWVCKFDVMKCAEILELPEEIEPIAMIPIGYPADEVDPERHEKARKPLNEMVHKNRYFYTYFKI